MLNNRFKPSLEEASDLFSTARKEALALLYKSRVPTKSRSIELTADYEEVAASCGYFSSTLQDVAEDMLTYLETLEELKRDVDRKPRSRSWYWLLFWRADRYNEKGSGGLGMSTRCIRKLRLI